MRVPSVPTAVGVAVLGFVGSLGFLTGLDTGVVVLPPYLDGTLLRAAPIFLTATVMVSAFNGARFRTNWLLVIGPSLAYTLHVFGPAFGPLAGGTVGVLSGVAVAGFVAGAGHATGRGYRELVDDAVTDDHRETDDPTR